jgi:O-antigen/teichoic acid export membrane protein
MQWRLGVSALVTYFLNSLYNPVMFRYHGAEVAGQMGMTLQMLTGLSVIAMSWITTKVPSFGALIAMKRYTELDEVWRRVSLISLGIILGGAVVFLLAVCVIKGTGIALSRRILDPLPTGVFLAATIIAQFVQCLVAYLRAHRREPIMLASVSICLGTGSLVWLLGSRWGPTGAAIGNLTVISLGAAWIWNIWRRCRRDWHVAGT